MADTLSDIFPAAEASRTIRDTQMKGGRVRAAIATIAVPDNADGDRLMIMKLPSNCRLLPMSTVYMSAITGMSDVDIGFAGAETALVDNQTFASATSISLMKSVAIGNHKKRLWELAGLSKDPGGEIEIFARCVAGSSTTGTVVAHALYVVD